MPVLVTAELHCATADVDDSAISTFVFDEAAGVTVADMLDDDIEGRVFEFYNSLIGVTGRRIGQYISSDRTDITFRCYDITGHLDGSPHGSPLKEVTVSGSDWGTGQPLPAQVAAVVSLHSIGRDDASVETADGADAGTARDRPMQRRTGRFYLGPLDVSAVDVAAGAGQCVLDETFRGDVLTAAERLKTTALSMSGAHWCIWSRADATVRDVSHIVMDNSPDVIRSRKIRYTVRTRADLTSE